MSEHHDPPHDHGPGGHDHGPGGHDHGPGPATPEAPPPEDTGTQALSEALSSSFFVVKIIMGLLVVAFLCSGVFSVPPDKVAIILRFGVPVVRGDHQLLGPGLHFGWPNPIDEVVLIPKQQIQSVKSSVGWFAVTPEQELAGNEPGPSGTLNPAIDGYTLTADGNIMHVRATLRYRIEDSVAYTFGFTSASNLVQNVVNNAIHHAAAHFTVDNALRHNRARFREAIEARVKALVAQAGLGVSVDLIEIDAKPPRDVKEAFNAVLDAEQTLGQTVATAQGYTNEILAKAQGEASSIINASKADATRMLQSIEADAKAFSDQLPLYRNNAALFTSRRLTETMQRVLTNAQDKWFLPERSDGKPREIRLLLNPEPPAPKTNQVANP